MEAKVAAAGAAPVELEELFSDLVRLETELWELVDQRLRRTHDLPLSWFEPMQVIERVPDCRVADIAQALSITVGGVSKLVDRIESAGWCVRTPNPVDGRSSVLALTRAGRRRLSAAQASFEDELDGCLGDALPAEELASFVVTLRALRHRVADHQRSSR